MCATLLVNGNTQKSFTILPDSVSESMIVDSGDESKNINFPNIENFKTKSVYHKNCIIPNEDFSILYNSITSRLQQPVSNSVVVNSKSGYSPSKEFFNKVSSKLRDLRPARTHVLEDESKKEKAKMDRPMFITTVRSGMFLEPPPEVAALLGLRKSSHGSNAESTSSESHNVVYSFSSKPRVLRSNLQTNMMTRNLLNRTEAKREKRDLNSDWNRNSNENNENNAQYGNTMFDRRVARGSNFASQRPNVTSTEHVLSRQAEARRRAAVRQRAQIRARKLRLSTPPPVDGRRHGQIQTDRYLEELTERPPDRSVEVQADLPLEDDSSLPFNTPLPNGIDAETQIYPGDLPDDEQITSVVASIVKKILQEAILEINEEIEMIRLRSFQLERVTRNSKLNVEAQDDTMITKTELNLLIQEVIENLKQTEDTSLLENRLENMNSTALTESIFNQIKNTITDMKFIADIIRTQIEAQSGSEENPETENLVSVDSANETPTLDNTTETKTDIEAEGSAVNPELQAEMDSMKIDISKDNKGVTLDDITRNSNENDIEEEELPENLEKIDDEPVDPELQSEMDTMKRDIRVDNENVQTSDPKEENDTAQANSEETKTECEQDQPPVDPDLQAEMNTMKIDIRRDNEDIEAVSNSTAEQTSQQSGTIDISDETGANAEVDPDLQAEMDTMKRDIRLDNKNVEVSMSENEDQPEIDPDLQAEMDTMKIDIREDNQDVEVGLDSGNTKEVDSEITIETTTVGEEENEIEIDPDLQAEMDTMKIDIREDNQDVEVGLSSGNVQDAVDKTIQEAATDAGEVDPDLQAEMNTMKIDIREDNQDIQLSSDSAPAKETDTQSAEETTPDQEPESQPEIDPDLQAEMDTMKIDINKDNENVPTVGSVESDTSQPSTENIQDNQTEVIMNPDLQAEMDTMKIDIAKDNENVEAIPRSEETQSENTDEAKTGTEIQNNPTVDPDLQAEMDTMKLDIRLDNEQVDVSTFENEQQINQESSDVIQAEPATAEATAILEVDPELQAEMDSMKRDIREDNENIQVVSTFDGESATTQQDIIDTNAETQVQTEVDPELQSEMDTMKIDISQDNQDVTKATADVNADLQVEMDTMKIDIRKDNETVESVSTNVVEQDESATTSKETISTDAPASNPVDPDLQAEMDTMKLDIREDNKNVEVVASSGNSEQEVQESFPSDAPSLMQVDPDLQAEMDTMKIDISNGNKNIAPMEREVSEQVIAEVNTDVNAAPDSASNEGIQNPSDNESGNQNNDPEQGLDTKTEDNENDSKNDTRSVDSDDVVVGRIEAEMIENTNLEPTEGGKEDPVIQKQASQLTEDTGEVATEDFKNDTGESPPANQDEGNVDKQGEIANENSQNVNGNESAIADDEANMNIRNGNATKDELESNEDNTSVVSSENDAASLNNQNVNNANTTERGEPTDVNRNIKTELDENMNAEIKESNLITESKETLASMQNGNALASS